MSVPLPDAKAEARKAAFARRKAAFARAGSGDGDLLAQVLTARRGVPLSGYLPIRTEIDPRAAMAEAALHGPVGVPVIEGAERPLRFRTWFPDVALVDGPFGAQVPQAGDWIVPQILIVPLVAFTRAGARLGYGGGFYDRTLALLRAQGRVQAIGFAFEAQEADALPQEPTDAPLDLIVTEREVIAL